MIHTRPQYDVAILFSGDGDFERVVELIRDASKNVYIFSEKSTLSNELKNSAGRHLVYFDQINEIIKQKD